MPEATTKVATQLNITNKELISIPDCNNNPHTGNTEAPTTKFNINLKLNAFARHSSGTYLDKIVSVIGI